YLFRKNSSRRLYVGSANLTEDGLNTSGEMSLKVSANSSDRITSSLESEFESLWREESFPLNKSVLDNYQKFARPPMIFISPQEDDAISSLLRRPERGPRPLPSKTKPCVAFVPDDITKVTAKTLRSET